MKKRRKTIRLSGCQVSIQREAEYISNCASRHDARVVTLGPLLFFSTQTGDAWALEPEDCLACCLARDGELMPSGITETPDNFAVEWEAKYRFDGSVMVFTDREGSERTVFGYPVREIQEAMRIAAVECVTWLLLKKDRRRLVRTCPTSSVVSLLGKPREVLTLIREAIELHLANIKGGGEPIPNPSSTSELVEIEAA